MNSKHKKRREPLLWLQLAEAILQRIVRRRWWSRNEICKIAKEEWIRGKFTSKTRDSNNKICLEKTNFHLGTRVWFISSSIGIKTWHFRRKPNLKCALRLFLHYWGEFQIEEVRVKLLCNTNLTKNFEFQQNLVWGSKFKQSWCIIRGRCLHALGVHNIVHKIYNGQQESPRAWKQKCGQRWG